MAFSACSSSAAGTGRLKTSRRALGEEHPNTLTAMIHLARTLAAQGQLGGARELQEQARKTSRRVPGEKHPATLTIMKNLMAIDEAKRKARSAR